MDSPLVFCLAVVAILITPGPTNTLLAASGAAVGFSRSVLLLAGELGGYNTAILAIRTLFEPLIERSAVGPVAARLAASACLLLLAAKLWRMQPNSRAAPVSLPAVFFTTLLNPKALVFALFIIPLQAPSVLPYIVAFSALVVVIGASWIAIGSTIREVTEQKYRTAIPKVAAVALVAFATVLVVSQVFA